MSTATVDQLNRQTLIARLDAELETERARKGEGTDWFSSGLINGLGRARALIANTVAEPVELDPSLWGQPVQELLDRAQTAYAEGNVSEALRLLDEARYRVEGELDEETD